METTANELARLERELLADVMSDISEMRRLRYNPTIFLDMISHVPPALSGTPG